MLEARPLCENFPQLLHQITLDGIKSPHDELILSYMPPRINQGTVWIDVWLLHTHIHDT